MWVNLLHFLVHSTIKQYCLSIECCSCRYSLPPVPYAARGAVDEKDTNAENHLKIAKGLYSRP